MSPVTRPRPGITADRSPVDPLLEEVRIAMAWNGGVSLAIWMGGVAVEIDAARRAPEAVQPATPDEQTRKIYAALSKAFRRQLVVDILCGASAGGLNGALLAAAMVNGRRLPVDLMRSKWIGIGDFGSLLQPMENTNPKSVMQGGSSPTDPGVFYREVRKFFAAILNVDGADPKEAEATQTPTKLDKADVLLDVMMTNVAGEPVSFRDVWGFELAAREYRAPLRFRASTDYTLEALATAARASASFPVAFEPFRIVGDAATRAGLSGIRYAIDGGLLENAPIKPAIEAVPTRPASTAVKRYVCYVNAAPPTAAPANNDPIEPTLRDVIGYIVNIPRDARFVDQLYAIQNEARRGVLSGKLQPDLLRMPMNALSATAHALLRTYRLRRLALDLQQIVADPARSSALVEQALDGDPNAENVRWLPVDVTPPESAEQWRWGIATAERILHLELDILRGLIPQGDTDARTVVLNARVGIEASLGTLEGMRTDFLTAARGLVNAPGELLADLEGLDLAYRERVLAAMDAAWESFSLVLTNQHLSEINDFGPFVHDLLAGDEETETDGRRHFMKRALSIEVIRRAFVADADADTAQQLLFAQLTPLAPTDIFRYGPGEHDRPDSGEQKLTGIRLGHFAAFYRSAWRANDFMWGRLDGATRIIDLLIDKNRAFELAGLGEPVRWETLANELIAAGAAHATVRDWLIEEALPPGGDGDLRERLTTAIKADMTSGDGSLTRRVCATLAQLEILAEELPILVDATASDEKLGCFTSPLKLKPTSDLKGAITTLRGGFTQPDGALPDLLGRDSSDESVSDLALHTLSQTIVVGLATMRNINVVFGKALAALRVPFVSINGLTARPRPTPTQSLVKRVLQRAPWERIGTVGSFAGASTFIALRLTTAHDRHAPLGSLWSTPTLLYLVSALAVAGVLIVPFLRVIRSTTLQRRGFQLLALVIIGGTAVGVPVILAAWRGGLPFAEIIATAGARGLPDWLTATALAVAVGGVPVLKFVPLPLPNKATTTLQRLPVTILLGAVGLILATYSSRYLANNLSGWHLAAAVSVWASIPAFIGYAQLGSRH